MTLPEVLLWQVLRRKQTGFRFRRQHPIGPYIADFLCPSAALVVEVDGGVHGTSDRSERDAIRDSFLQENGYRVMRIGAVEVLRDVEAVVAVVVSLAALPLHHASHGSPPRSGEE